MNSRLTVAEVRQLATRAGLAVWATASKRSPYYGYIHIVQLAPDVERRTRLDLHKCGEVVRRMTVPRNGYRFSVAASNAIRRFCDEGKTIGIQQD